MGLEKGLQYGEVKYGQNSWLAEGHGSYIGTLVRGKVPKIMTHMPLTLGIKAILLGTWEPFLPSSAQGTSSASSSGAEVRSTVFTSCAWISIGTQSPLEGISIHIYRVYIHIIYIYM